jgi:hypothetical protein
MTSSSLINKYYGYESYISGKGRVIPVLNKLSTAMNTWRSGGMASPFLTAALDRAEWSASRLGRFTPGEIDPVPSL